MPKRKGILFTLIVGVVSAFLLAGCTPTPPAKQMVLDPKVVKTWAVDYWVASDAAGTAISPDNKYVLLVQGGPEERIVAAVPLAADDQKDIPLYTVSNSYLQNSSLDFIPVGWLSETQCMFLATGWQYQGPHKEQRGVAVLIGDVSKSSAEEMTFIPLEEGSVHNVRYQPETGKVYLDITQAIWTVDVKSKTAKLVKGGLPTYDGMFMARMSPDSSAYVYQLHELDGEHGIFMLDAVTGAEKPFALNGDTMSFYPSWSPDGKYVAMYNVPRKPGRTETTWVNYAVYPGEDGPMPIAPAITVMDRSGNLVKTISVEGKVLVNFKWSPDSKSIAFVAGPEPATVPDTEVDWDIPVITWDSVYAAKAQEQGAAAKLSDLDATMAKDAYVAPVAFDPESRGVYVQVSGEEGVSSVWYLASGKTPVQTEENKPVKVADGNWQYYPEVTKFGDSIAAIINNASGTSASGTSSLWLLNSKEVKKAGEWSASYTMVVGYNAGMLVTSENDKVTVRTMYSEKVGK